MVAGKHRGSKRHMRTGAAAAIAVLLLGTSAFASFRHGVGILDDYPPNKGGGFSGGAIAGAAAGAVIVGAGALAAAGVFGAVGAAGLVVGADTALTPTGDANIGQALPDGADADRLRIVPANTRLGVGETRVFDLQARNAGDHKWYSVINRPNASLDLRNPSHCVMKVDGSKNSFAVPANVSPSCNGQVIPLLGTYTRNSGSTLTADANIRVMVAGSPGR
jgi:hypothetical protein